MKTPRIKLALIVGMSVTAALALALLSFNLIMSESIKQDCENAIDEVLCSREAETPPNHYAFVMSLDSEFSLLDADYDGHSALDRDIASWCAAHPRQNVLNKATVGGKTCYVKTATQSFDEAPIPVGPLDGNTDEAEPRSGDGLIAVAYVDVTAEENLIGDVDRALAAIMLLVGGGAAAAGYLTGRQIERADQARKSFYENMSHELKTPLAAIRGYAEGLETGVITDFRAAGAVIDGESQKMADLIGQILGLSRLESGLVKLKREPVPVSDFVQDCLMPFDGLIQVKGLQVTLDLAEGSVSADPGQFEHAFTNVVSNAVKYAQSRIAVRYDGIRLSVWNDCGRLPSDLDRLFDRFNTQSHGGTGIGLALALKISEMHGWKISAERANGGLLVAFCFEGKRL